MKKENGINEIYLKEIYLNVLKAIIVVLYFFILNISYENIARENLLVGIKVLTMIFLFVSIYIFEKAYKKDDGKLAIQGIEVLVLAGYTLTTEHITNKFDFNFKSYSLVTSYIFAIYFILRCIIIYTKGRKELEKCFSDIREIVQKEKPTKKEATKKTKNEIVKNEKVDDTNGKNVVKKQNRAVNTTSKTKKNANTDKRKTENKTKNENNEKEIKTKTVNKNSNSRNSNASKKKTTSNTVKKQNIENVNKVKKQNSENTKENPKRKRVKKEVNEND